MASIKINVHIDDALRRRLEAVNNPTTMLAIHNTLARMCDPYVPFLEGPLSQTTVITSKSVKYTQPYARYQYYGEIYGPNIPIKDSEGNVVGWFSPPGQKKHPTGRMMQHSKEKHPLASSKWDEVMLRDKGEEFNKEVKDIIHWRLLQTNG